MRWSSTCEILHSFVRRGRGVRLPDVAKLCVEFQIVESVKREGEKQTDSSLQKEKGIPERPLDVGFTATNSRRIRNAPMRSRGMTRPYRADFVGSIVTNGKNEIELGSFWARELFPTLATQALDRDLRLFELMQRL